ncbi:hypothetical protein [Micromonospora zhanjiangensis]
MRIRAARRVYVPGEYVGERELRPVGAPSERQQRDLNQVVVLSMPLKVVMEDVIWRIGQSPSRNQARITQGHSASHSCGVTDDSFD